MYVGSGSSGKPDVWLLSGWERAKDADPALKPLFVIDVQTSSPWR